MVWQSDRLPEPGAETTRSERPDPEALPGGNDLLEYKRMLKEVLDNLPEADPDEIEENNIKNFKVFRGNLRKIEQGIKNRRYQSTRAAFHISADAVSIKSNEAIEELSVIIAMIRRYKGEKNAEEKEVYVRKLHRSLDNCRTALRTALNEFSQVRRLRRSGK